ncbi:hypothetical protein ES332_D02G123600v1 [Gossypium tomentosum]|uniref:Thioredoxin domain-containing protein n=1 Tax=Gossypium tomentosum TaxID=34277 RepID=A0A5D2LW94_GOSTO|nr:hypothetical protein ES332_D02G123600v1 [Gossypium tomentosum]
MAEEGQLINCQTFASWNEQLHAANASMKLAVVSFTASWCVACRFITPVVVELAKKLPDVIFLKVDADDLKTVTRDFAVEALPTFIFMKQGKIVDKVLGQGKMNCSRK